MVAERQVIKDLGFGLVPVMESTVQKHIVEFFGEVGERDEKVIKECWTLVCEYYLGPLCVFYRPEKAVRAIYMMVTGAGDREDTEVLVIIGDLLRTRSFQPDFKTAWTAAAPVEKEKV